MIFTTRSKKINVSTSIKICNHEISRVDHSKFLGIVIDDKLNWSYHINSIKNKIAKGIGVICKAKRFLSKKTLLTLYYSFIYPYLHYGISARGNTYKSYIDPLIKIQKRAIRIISSARHDAHSEPLFCELNLLPLCKIYIMNVQMFMFKYYHGLLPKVFENMFTSNTSVHEHYTRQQVKYHSPLWRLEIVRRGIRIQGARFWNYMLDKINYMCSPLTYKFHLKRFLLNNGIDL